MSAGRRPYRPEQRRVRHHAGPVAAIALLMVVAGAAVYYATAPPPASAALRQAAPQPKEGARNRLSSVHWTTVFEDDFAGKEGSAFGSSWRFFQGTGIGIGRFVASPSVVHLDGLGHLVVTTMKTSQGWLSGEVQTTHAYMPAPGQEMLVESSLEMPEGGRGYWPAFWGLGVPALTNPKTEPMAGEDDIAETINDYPWIGQFMHCGRSNKLGPCGLDTQVESPLSVPSGESGWHTFSWLWSNKGSNPYVAFYIDNKVEMKVTEQQIGEKYWTLSFDHPYVFIYDLAIGGWASPPGKSTAPSASMKVDFIRIEIS
jgi:hypothetical protein